MIFENYRTRNTITSIARKLIYISFFIILLVFVFLKMAGQETMKATCKIVRPILSRDYCEAHRQVLRLYRAVYRYIPYIVKYFDIEKDEQACRWKLREYFYRNAFITDLRIIDILVIKGFMELKEITHGWQQKGHVINNWHPSIEPKPCSFLGKFLSGSD